MGEVTTYLGIDTMCINAATELFVPSLTAFKVVHKVKGGYTSIFESALDWDDRTYEVGVEYESDRMDPSEGFHGLGFVNAKKLYDELCNGWTNWNVRLCYTRCRKLLRIVICTLEGDLLYDDYKGATTVVGKRMTIHTECPGKLYRYKESKDA